MLVHSDSRIPRRVLAAWQHSMLSRAWWDPIWRRKSERLRRAHGREYGAAITAVRKERKLKQTEVPGISERQLRRIEQSGAVSVRTLKQLAEAYGMALEDYLNAVASKIQHSRKHGSNPIHRLTA
jgi:hypothetical protein